MTQTRRTLVSATSGLLWLSMLASSSDAQTGHLLTGLKFRQEIERPISLSWTLAEPRLVLKDISAERRISIVMDRRLDPSREFPVDIKDLPLQAGLASIARSLNGELVVTDKFAYLGPKSAAKHLRTLIELRKHELASQTTGISERRRSELQRQRTFAWNDLESPREILATIATTFRVAVTGDEQIPHDLWAAAVLPDATVSEVLSVVLIQFDLTFRWADSGSTVDLIPIPKKVLVDRKHVFKQKPTEALAIVRRNFADVDAELSNSELVIRCTVEEHEAITQLLRGDRPVHPTRVEAQTDVKRRRFTYRAEQPIPISAVMTLFKESGIQFEYDVDELKAAGIDLEQTIQLDVNNLLAEDFFKMLFGPARLDFQMEKLTVKLTPKKNISKN